METTIADQKENISKAINDFIEVVTPKTHHTFSRNLGKRERGVLNLALEKKPDLILMDDKKARNEARELGFNPYFTTDMLKKAEGSKIIPFVLNHNMPKNPTYYIKFFRIVIAGLVGILLLVFYSNVRAQTYPFKHYSTADGLAHAVVRKVFQDSRGFLWFGTHGGTNRYDGNEFVSYLTQDSLKSEIFDIWKDGHGTIWFATYGNGLAKLRANDTTFIWMKASDGTLPGDDLDFIFKDPDQNIWIGGGAGLTLWKRDGTIHIYDQELGANHGEVYAMAREKDGVLWIGTHGGLLTGQLGFDNQLKFKRILDRPIQSLLLLKDGNVLAGTSGGGNDRYGVVVRFHHDVLDTIISYQTTHSLIKAQTLFEDRKGRIWIGTEYGLYLLEAAKITHLRRENELHNENIYDITEDREGTLWFGTENGVMKLVTPNFLSYGMKDGLSSYKILSMLLDRQPNLWFGTQDGISCLTLANRSQDVPVPMVYLDGVSAGDNERQVVDHSVTGYKDRSIVFKFNIGKPGGL